MAIEIEKKFKLTAEQFEDMRQRLKDASAELEGSCFESNRLFSDDRLREMEAYVRLRQTETVTTLTYKRLLSPESGLKKQLEIESRVEDREAVEAIVTELGLTMVLIYEKERETWRLGDAEVVLDRLPFGLYMEIEGSVEAIESAEKIIISKEIIPEPLSYPKLTFEFGSRSNGVVMAVFPDNAIPM